MEAKILIVDDEKHLSVFLRKTMQLEFPESRVDTAYSGEEALSRLAERSYDLILADLRMPGLDGLQLVKGVRYLDPNVPIVLMTGFGSDSLAREAARLGVNQYLDKPFDVRELLRVVRRLLSERSDKRAD